MKFFHLFLFAFLAVMVTACGSSKPEVPQRDPVPEVLQESTAEEVDGVFVEEVSYYPDLPAAVGYLARPKGNGPHPAVILIHEWWGMNDNIRENARKYAQEGYVALAVDMYAGESAETPDEARELATKVRERVPQAFTNLKNAVSYLKGYSAVDPERLASVGWCFGGQWSYEMAKNDLGVDASVIYYGRFNPEDDLELMKAKIIGHFGEEDQSIPVDDVKAFQAKLKTQSGEHEIYVYENAGHAFANSDNDAYQEESAERAWERTQEFLTKHL